MRPCCTNTPLQQCLERGKRSRDQNGKSEKDGQMERAKSKQERECMVVSGG